MASEGVKRAYKKRKHGREYATKSIKEAKRLTSGVMAKHGIFSLDEPKFLEGYNERKAEKLEEEKEVYSDKRGKSRRVSIPFLGCEVSNGDGDSMD